MKSDNLKLLRELYPQGTKVQLERMDDLHAPPIGCIGVVQFIDDAGQIHVNWETGSTLALIPECDKFKVLN